MRFFTCLLICFTALLGACSEGGKKFPENRVGERQSPSGDFYKRLTGTIAGKPVVMHLHRMGDWVGGVYFYTVVGVPISLVSWNDVVTGDDVLELQEFSEAGPLDESYTYPRLHLTLTDGGAKGKWISADSGRSYSVELKEDYGDGSIRLEAISFFDSARRFPSRSAPSATANYSTVTPVDDADESWIVDAIRSSFGDHTSDTWPDFFRALARDYFTGYQRDVSVDTSKPSDAESAMHNWTTESRATVLMNDRHWLVIRCLTADYTGGAHGNHGSSFLVLDRKGERSWTLTDVVSDTATLTPFLTTAAADRWRIPPDAPLSGRLLVETVPLTTNFYLTSAGLGFVYNPYEIASYADGEVHLFIPYKRIMFLLTKEFKQRMGLSDAATMRG